MNEYSVGNTRRVIVLESSDAGTTWTPHAYSDLTLDGSMEYSEGNAEKIVLMGSSDSGITWHPITDPAGSAAVESVNGKTGVVVLDSVDVGADASGAATSAVATHAAASDPHGDRAYSVARANHTGTQTASTVSDFDTQVRTSRLDQMAAPSANLSMASHKVTSVTDPTSAQDAATKNYADTAVGGTAWTVVRKTADESVASSTVDQNDDHLFFTPASGTVYEVEIVLLYDSPAGGGTPDIKMDVGEDATIRGEFHCIGLTTADAAGTQTLLSNQTGTVSFGTAATKRVCKLIGYHAGNGGTFNVRWAQATSGSNATRVLTGSVLRYRAVT